MDELDVDVVVEEVEKRHQVRRAEDTRKNALLVGIAGLLVAGGIAWGTASAVVAQKVDRGEFITYVSHDRERAIVDSVKLAQQGDVLQRVSMQLDSTNIRLSRLVCDKQPAYCK